MLLTTYNPQRAFNKSYFNLFADDTSYKTAWQLAIDVGETEQAFILTADVPGVADENLALTVDDNVLTISGKRESITNKQDDHNIHRIERSEGEFKRIFTLPENADIENIIANKKDGVLLVEIPKKPKEQAKKINIKFN